MLRLSWRPGRAVLSVEGLVDFEHADILTIAAACAAAGRGELSLDLEGAELDDDGRRGLDAMVRELKARHDITVRRLHPQDDGQLQEEIQLGDEVQLLVEHRLQT